MTDRPGSSRRRGRPARSRRLSLVAGASAILVATLASGAPAASATSAEAPAGTVRADKADALPGMWWYDAMNIAEAHEQVTGNGVTIAVIDGPVDPTVPELRGQDVTPVRNYCANPGEDPVATATATGPKAQHATAITALLVGNGRGTGPGGAGISGIAPDASVRNYVIDEAPEGRGKMRCSEYDGDVLDPEVKSASIRDAVKDGADIINLSYTGQLSRPVANAIEYAFRNNAVVTVSAGNEGARVGFPATVAGVVSVGMLDRTATAAGDSNYGVHLVVTAPGVAISAGDFSSGRWSSRAVGKGTSYSAPITAGAVALIRERYPAADNWQLVRHLIYRAGGDEKFDWGERVGFGAVSVTRMLADKPTKWRDTNPFADIPPEGFIEYGDNELTGTPEQLADYTTSPSAPPDTSEDAQAGDRSEQKSSQQWGTGTVALAVGAGVTCLGLAAGVAWWLRRRA